MRPMQRPAHIEPDDEYIAIIEMRLDAVSYALHKLANECTCRLAEKDLEHIEECELCGRKKV